MGLFSNDWEEIDMVFRFKRFKLNLGFLYFGGIAEILSQGQLVEGSKRYIIINDGFFEWF